MTAPLRVGFAAPMLGGNSGYVLSQAEILADLFSQSGYDVFRTSTIPSPFPRLFDMVKSVISWRNQVDVVIHSVFSGKGFINTDIVSYFCKILKIPIIFALHGGALPAFAQEHKRWLERTFSRANAFVSPSNYLASFFFELGYSVHVIPNVLKMSDYPFQLRSQIKPNLIWMRSFHPIYHPDMAIRVLQCLQPLFPHARLTMAGSDKGLLPGIKTLAAECGLAGNVKFVGFLDLLGKQNEFSDNDIFLNTNRVDNMPVSVLEAAAFGLPIVATKVGGIPYLLQHEQTGLLVEDGNVEEMSEAVMRLLQDPELAAHLSMEGRRLAEMSSWTAVKTQWEALFAAL